AHPVEAKRDREVRPRQRRAKAAARFLPQPPERRPAFPCGEPGQQVNRDPARTALGPAVQTGPIMRSSRKVLIANANHSTVPFTHAKAPYAYRKHAKRTFLPGAAP